MKKITMPKQNAKNEAVSANRKRLLNNDSPFAIKESYVKLRTILMFCMTADSKRACRTFAITSSNPSDGKSLTAANVVISFTMLGKKTLLIDADMRKPNQRRLWRTNPTTGLCDFLAKIQDLCIYDVEGISFSIVCTGTIPPNPSELLSSEGMKNFVEECSKLYEYIIIDTPPINMVADAQIVSTFVDGVVLIAKSGNTSTGGEFSLSFYSKIKSKEVFLFELSVGSQSNGYRLGTYTDEKGKEQSVWLNINEITPDSSWSQDEIDEINKTQSCVNELIDQLNQIDGFKAAKQK